MIDWCIERYPILASTNDLALERIRSGSARAGDVIVAEEQLAGRGRPGRAWVSPKGALLMTAILPFQPKRVGWVSLAAGIAVASAVRCLEADACVKWPNDVLLGGRKLGGILVETSVPGLVAVGIGINVSNALPDDPRLAARSARLADAIPDATPELLLDVMLAQLLIVWELLAAPDLSPLQRAWRSMDTTIDRTVQWSEGGVVGTAAGVDNAGALLIRLPNGKTIAAAVGEVVFADW